MTGVTGSGPWPGTDPLEAQAAVLGDLVAAPSDVTGLPFAPVLVDRRPWADLVGRGVALLVDLPAELGPHGWRLTARPGHDLVRARSALRDDLDALAVAAHGYTGPLVVPVLGPLSLAAVLALAGGERVVSDPSALRDLADSLAAGLAEHLAALVRAVPGALPQVLLREGELARVLAAGVPTFSGRATLRSVSREVAGSRLAAVVVAARAAGATTVAVGGGSSSSMIGPVVDAAADAVVLEVDGVNEHGWETVAEAVEQGMRVWAEVPPPGAGARPDGAAAADALIRPWRRVGLPAAGLADAVLVAPPTGVWTPEGARAALAHTVTAARIVAEAAA